MKLSSVREGQTGVFTDHEECFRRLCGKRFLVTDRIPEDRSSGLTTVHLEDGARLEFVWDHENPLVKLLGTGRLDVKVVFD